MSNISTRGSLICGRKDTLYHYMNSVKRAQQHYTSQLTPVKKRFHCQNSETFEYILMCSSEIFLFAFYCVIFLEIIADE